MMRSALYFILVLCVNGILFWGVYFIGSHALSVFEAPPGLFMPLTAFAYTAQIVALALTMAVMNLQIARSIEQGAVGLSFVKRRVRLTTLMSTLRFIFAVCLLWLCASVFSNKVIWLWSLLFEADKFGYDETGPSMSAISSVFGLLGLMSISYVWTFGERLALWLTALSFFVILTLAGIAACYVAGFPIA